MLVNRLRIAPARGPAALLAFALGVMTPAMASAEIFTVGEGGEHPTIAAALVIANAVAGDHEVRVRAGTYHEANLRLSPDHDGLVDLTGGWDGDFASRDLDPRSTVVDAQRLNVVLVVIHSMGQVRVRGLTLRGGSGDSGAAGVDVNLSGSASLELADCHVLDNRVVADSARGAGLTIRARDDAVVLVSRLRIEDNVSEGTVDARAAGLEAFPNGQARLELFDTLVRGNRVEGVAASSATGIVVGAHDAASVTIRRLRVVDNEGADGGQVSLTAFGGATSFTDSVIAGGSGGVQVTAVDGEIAVANLTVADTLGRSIGASIQGATGRVDVANSLFFGTGSPPEFREGVTHGNNLDGVDPLFADAQARDYRLLAGSPAIDAGRLDPEAGLGPSDASGNPRVSGAGVDIGAHELGPSECSPSSTTLCLNDERFQIDVTWTATDGTLAEAENVELTEDSGYFWFFEPSNVEMLVKALDACVINDRLWFFAGGLTDVKVSTRVTDTATGDIRVYQNPSSQAFESVLDSDAFPNCGVAANTESSASRTGTGAVVRTRTRTPAATTTSGVAACVESETTLCLGAGRFAVTAAWRSSANAGGGHQGVLTADTGTFWFFEPTNLEIVLKVLDACSINQQYWVYAAGLTDVEVILTVTDTVSGETVAYANPLGQVHETITDVEALPCS